MVVHRFAQVGDGLLRRDSQDLGDGESRGCLNEGGQSGRGGERRQKVRAGVANDFVHEEFGRSW